MTHIVGLMLARNEEWILECTIPAAMEWVDTLVVLDHASTDSTPQIIASMIDRFPGRIVSLEVHDTEHWDEMDHRQMTLEVGRKIGGTHFAIIDADEMIRYDSVPIIRQSVESLIPRQILQVPLFCMWRSPYQYRSDNSVWGRAKLTLAFGDSPDMCWATRDGYHHHNRTPSNTHSIPLLPFPAREYGGACHLQWVDWERVKAKHAWYKMMERVRWGKDHTVLNRVYGQALNESMVHVSTMPASWMLGWRDLINTIRIGEPSWHVAECRRLLEKYGRAKFAGLDLFGVV